jgi:hypothetical protein
VGRPKPVGYRVEVDPNGRRTLWSDAQVAVGDVARAAVRVDVADPDSDVCRRGVGRVGEFDVGNPDYLEC